MHKNTSNSVSIKSGIANINEYVTNGVYHGALQEEHKLNIIQSLIVKTKYVKKVIHEITIKTIYNFLFIIFYNFVFI